MPKCEWERHGGESVAKTAEFVCGGIDGKWERERERAASIFAHSYHWGAVVLCKDRKIRLIRKQMLKANTRIYDMEIKRNATATAKDENYHRVWKCACLDHQHHWFRTLPLSYYFFLLLLCPSLCKLQTVTRVVGWLISQRPLKCWVKAGASDNRMESLHYYFRTKSSFVMP